MRYGSPWDHIGDLLRILDWFEKTDAKLRALQAPPLNRGCPEMGHDFHRSHRCNRCNIPWTEAEQEKKEAANGLGQP